MAQLSATLLRAVRLLGLAAARWVSTLSRLAAGLLVLPAPPPALLHTLQLLATVCPECTARQVHRELDLYKIFTVLPNIDLMPPKTNIYKLTGASITAGPGAASVPVILAARPAAAGPPVRGGGGRLRSRCGSRTLR